MKTKNVLLTRSNERGHTVFDWLDSHHSFSFGDFYDPRRMGFGPLRVLNDDRVAPKGGFPPHPHRDMEIVSIVLDGKLEHKDSMGNGRVIQTGDIQYMSAGSGVVHSEFNPSDSEPVHFLQIWIEPEKKGLPPLYEDRKLLSPEKNSWSLVLSEDGRDNSITIRRSAELRSAVLESGASISHRNDSHFDGQWLFVLAGEIEVEGNRLSEGDSLALEGVSSLEIVQRGETDAEIMLFSVPLAS